jgi:hypothetical protein
MFLSDLADFGTITLPKGVLTPQSALNWIKSITNSINTSTNGVTDIVTRAQAAATAAKTAGQTAGAGQATVNAANQAIAAMNALPKLMSNFRTLITPAVGKINGASNEPNAEYKLRLIRAAVDAYNRADVVFAQIMAAAKTVTDAAAAAQAALPGDQSRTQAVTGIRAQAVAAVETAKKAVANANRAKTALTPVLTARQARGLRGYFGSGFGYFGAFGDTVDDYAQRAVDAANQAVSAANAAVAEANKASPDPTQVTYYVGQVNAYAQTAQAAADSTTAAVPQAIAALQVAVPSTPVYQQQGGSAAPATTSDSMTATPDVPTGATSMQPTAGNVPDAGTWEEAIAAASGGSMGPAEGAAPPSAQAGVSIGGVTIDFKTAALVGLAAIILLRR